MKMNILKNGCLVLIIISLMIACSLGDVLEPFRRGKHGINGNGWHGSRFTGRHHKFQIYSINQRGNLRRIEIAEKSHDFNELKDSIRFALVDETLELTVDEEGYLSRPVSSVMLIYPVIVPNDKEIVGEVLSMTFKAYNEQREIRKH